MRNLLRHLPVAILTCVLFQPWQAGLAQPTPEAEQAILRGYQKAPQPISDILNAPPTPQVQVSPNSKWLLVADRLANPPIADLAQPMLRLAGLRINPATNGRHHPPRFVRLHLYYTLSNERAERPLPPNAPLAAPA